jgi:hypothetical protein
VGGRSSKPELDALLFLRWVVEWFIERLALICIAKAFQQSMSAPDLYCFGVYAEALSHLDHGKHPGLS